MLLLNIEEYSIGTVHWFIDKTIKTIDLPVLTVIFKTNSSSLATLRIIWMVSWNITINFHMDSQIMYGYQPTRAHVVPDGNWIDLIVTMH